MQRKVVLVTGGSTGIGLAIARYLEEKGCKVYATSRSVARKADHSGITMLAMNLDNPKQITEVVAEVLSREGRIDALVNNAGMGMAGALEDASNAEIKELFDANVFGLLECCRSVIPGMRSQGRGHIINISSIAGNFGLPFRGAYSASKAAVDRFSETLRMELKPWNIKVSVVKPGDFKTNINNNRIIAARGLEPRSAYFDGFRKHYRLISEDVSKAHDPILVARVVWKIISTNHPKMYYPVATTVQKLGILLDKLLPKHWFQQMLTRRYPIK